MYIIVSHTYRDVVLYDSRMYTYIYIYEQMMCGVHLAHEKGGSKRKGLKESIERVTVL